MSVNLTLETLASKQRNDSTVAGVTVKDALETLEGLTSENNEAIIPLSTTFTNCENTTSAINIVTITIPANTLEVGDIINIEYYSTILQNSGIANNLTQTLAFNGNAISSPLSSIASSASIRYQRQTQKFTVTSVGGANLTIEFLRNGSGNNSLLFESLIVAIGATSTGNMAMTDIYSLGSINKTTNIILTLSAQWGTANPNSYIRVREAQAYIIKKAV